VPDTTIPPGGALPPPRPPEDVAPEIGSIPSVHGSVYSLERPRAGHLTTAWHAMVVATWVGVFVAYAAVWKASEELGLATWWLGPRANPQPLIVRLGPFIVAVVFGLLAIYNVRRLPILGLVGATVLAAIAVPDLWRSTGLATVEFAIAGAVVLVSTASFTGTYRRARSDHAR
jgi:predicted membrane channel-forming protein YqfA (hemolysin III family)